MRTVYESINGKIFYEMGECIEYEKTLAFKMYDDEGLTSRTDECFIVDIKTPEAAERFIETCDTNGDLCDGIRHGTTGVYVWSANDQKYFLLDPYEYKALKKYFNDIATQE